MNFGASTLESWKALMPEAKARKWVCRIRLEEIKEYIKDWTPMAKSLLRYTFTHNKTKLFPGKRVERFQFSKVKYKRNRKEYQDVEKT